MSLKLSLRSFLLRVVLCSVDKRMCINRLGLPFEVALISFIYNLLILLFGIGEVAALDIVDIVTYGLSDGGAKVGVAA